MKTSVWIALVSALVFANCGGTTDPPSQPPPQQSPAPEAAAPVDIPAPPNCLLCLSAHLVQVVYAGANRAVLCVLAMRKYDQQAVIDDVHANNVSDLSSPVVVNQNRPVSFPLQFFAHARLDRCWITGCALRFPTKIDTSPVKNLETGSIKTGKVAIGLKKHARWR